MVRHRRPVRVRPARARRVRLRRRATRPPRACWSRPPWRWRNSRWRSTRAAGCRWPWPAASASGWRRACGPSCAAASSPARAGAAGGRPDAGPRRRPERDGSRPVTRSLQGRILTPAGLVEGSLRIGEDGRIAAIEGEPVALERAREPGAAAAARLHRPARARRRRPRHHGRRRRRAAGGAQACRARHDGAAGHDHDRADGGPARRAGAGRRTVPRRRAGRRPRAGHAPGGPYINKPASWARSRTSRGRCRWTSCRSCMRWRRSGC